MKVVPFSAVPAGDWNAACEASSSAWVFHRAEWVGIESRWGGCEGNLSFALVDRERVVGVLPLYLSEIGLGAFTERLLHCGIHRHTGLALVDDLDAGTVAAARTAALREVKSLAGDLDVHRIQLNVQNAAPANRDHRREEVPFWVTDHAFHLGLHFTASGFMPAPGLSTCAADQIVDLMVSEEEMFSRLDPACRRAVRKALKAGMEMIRPPHHEAIERYYAIARVSQRRTGESLPNRKYYEALWQALAPGRAEIMLAVHEGRDVAGLLVSCDKECLNFMAGVSDPDALDLRPNDFIHWAAMAWGRSVGYTVYRLGPSFPELPQDGPVAKVARFKTKFGGRSVPVLQGSFFLKPRPYLEAAATLLGGSEDEVLDDDEEQSADTPFWQWSRREQVVAHHLRIFGLRDGGLRKDGRGSGAVRFLNGATSLSAGFVAQRAAVDRLIIVLAPSETLCHGLGLRAETVETSGAPLRLVGENGARGRLRTLHPYTRFSSVPKGAEGLVVDETGAPVWLWIPGEHGGAILLVGSRVAEDLVRFRQGDPAKAVREDKGETWGFDFERPVHLYEDQIEGFDRFDRPADWLAWALMRILVTRGGLPCRPMLPDSAPGAIVITGDDDQAYLEKYAEQREALEGARITYFLHPLTRHTPETLAALTADGTVDLGLHPDALEEPERYAELFAEQAAWFRDLTGFDARSVRNHGFLNDGYWGHLKPWVDHGIAFSSNIPGVDGRVLNGSLLPSRMMAGDTLTDHWSALTAIGDGVVFALGMTVEESADCVLRAADRIRTSGVPGVLVVNLHPQNVVEARGLHQAILALREAGFLLWNVQDCLSWFSGLDDLAAAPGSDTPTRLAQGAPTDAVRAPNVAPSSPGPVEALISRWVRGWRGRNGAKHKTDEPQKLAWERRAELAWVDPPQARWHSFDRQPWRHPWLTVENISAMRDYSAHVIADVMRLREDLPDQPRRYAFVNNIANNLYNRAVPLRRAGMSIDIFPHPQDDYVMSAPEWEEFDGVVPNGETSWSKVALLPNLSFGAMNGVHRISASFPEWYQTELAMLPDFVRVEDFLKFGAYMTYLPVFKALQNYDALLTIQAPYMAYLANRPYIAVQAGGDIWFEAARDDLLGRLQRRSFQEANAFLASNPWSFAHARRYGMTNQLYVPMIIDEDVYSPGPEPLRQQWEQSSGGTFFVLTTARLDDFFKGTSVALEGFRHFAAKHPGARLLVTGWGEDHERHMEALREHGLADRIIGLPMSGKRRLLRYLRAADCLLDQFAIGYFGATGLEGMACGLPVIMRLEHDQYQALCETGAPPVLQADSAAEVARQLERLAADPAHKAAVGAALRQWFLDNHGSRRWAPVYEALMAVTAAGHTIDFGESPLCRPLTDAEHDYHAAELAAAPEFPNYR